ncbi:MAG TPA: PKD domain-containing protein [Bacteroidia bacterium]|nr:PKD domain-containing protein [Bacteroidia bacterium]
MIKRIQENLLVILQLLLSKAVFLFFMLSFTSVSAQDIIIPPSYIFYQGDTLKGFNWKEALDNPTAKSANSKELLPYLKERESEYVIEKYNLVNPYVNQIDAANAFHKPLAGSPCNNVDFEDGNYTGWTGYIGENKNSAKALFQTVAGINTLGINSGEKSCSWQTLVTTGTDPYGNFPMLDPGGGIYACRLGGEKTNLNWTYACGNSTDNPNNCTMGEVLEQTFAVTNANSLFIYKYAVVLNDGGHPNGEEPYFRVEVLNSAGDTIPCLQFYVQGENGAPPPGFSLSGKTSPQDGTNVYYLGWTTNTLNLKPYVGTNVTVRFTAAGCTLGGHFGYAYIDCSCSQIWPTVAPSCSSSVLTAPGGGSSYTWTGPGIVSGGNTISATVNASGTYSVTVGMGRAGCQYVLDTTITVPGPIVVNTSSAPAVCTNNIGSASVTSITGGTPSFTYSWSSGQTTSTLNNLPAGSYTVTVKDANGCTQQATVVVAHNTATPTPTITGTNPLCNGGTGSAVATTITGGTAPYTYAWSNGKTTTSVTGLAVGTYTLNMTDANGCTGSGTVTITQPTAIVITTSTAPTTCTGSTGTASVTNVTGGTSPYTYSWNNGQTTTSITGLPIGSYTVTVKDANGCTKTATVTVTSVTLTLTPTTTEVNELCNGGSTGSVSVTGVTNGTAPYTYTWNAGQTTTTVTGLPPGTYTVTAKDANGCTGTATATITQPAVIAVTTSTTPTTCSGSTGTASVTGVTGGTSPYTYSWNNGKTTSSINALPAGSYTVTVKDVNGCSKIATVTVGTTGATITPTVTGVNELCNGGNTGSASVTGATGGSAPYTYTWSNGKTTTTITALPVGTYTVTAKDNNGCVGTKTITITQPTVITVATTSSPTTCSGTTGTAGVSSASGGTGAYTYLWNNGATTSTLNNLASGSYTVTVKDANGCTKTAIATVGTTGAVITSTTTSTNDLCNGDSTGSVSVTGSSGGLAPYTYTWSTGQTTTTVTGLPVGAYIVTALDVNGCNGTDTAFVTQPTPIVITTDTTPTICTGSVGTASVTNVTGGAGGYTYVWSNTLTTSSINALAAGTYTVTVKDANGCTNTATAIVGTVIDTLKPTATSTNELCFGDSNGTASVTGVTNGTAPYIYSWNSGQTTSSVTGLLAGSYTVNITDNNGCTGIDSATITQPLAMVVTTTSTPTTCSGSTGTAGVTSVTNGTPNYSYSWSNGKTTSTISNLTVGSYTVTITDANSCSQTDTVVVAAVGATVTPAVSSTNVLCFGDSNGTVSVTGATGGTGPYTYLWSTGQTTTTVTGLFPGTYTVTATGVNGCSGSITDTVGSPTQLNPSTAATMAVCNGQNGSATVTTTGGTAGYTYLWSNGISGDSINAVAGSYSVTITDANGCVDSAAAVIAQPAPITATTEIGLATCTVANGSAGVTSVFGGTGPYTYLWNSIPAQTTDTATHLFAGNYTVTITDANNCSSQVAVVVTNANGTRDSIVATTNILCFGGNNGSITLGVASGVPPYTFVWSNGATTQNLDSITAGIYSVTVADTKGCKTTAIDTITQPPPLHDSIINPINEKCFNDSIGSLTGVVTGGTPGYSYTWNPAGGTNAIATGLGASIYTLSVTDADGCLAMAIDSVTQPPQLTLSAAAFPATCFNSCNGQLGSIPGGGVTPYSYSWNNATSSTTASVLNVCAGTYSVLVTDANGCKIDSIGLVVTQPTALRDSITSIINNKCFGDSTGSLAVGVTGGSPGYTYSWSTIPLQSTDSATGLKAGTYTVTITDSHGCVDTVSGRVTQPTQVASTTAPQTICISQSALVTVTSIGGTPGYSYIWLPGNQTTATITVSPTVTSTYTVITTDTNNCPGPPTTVVITVNPPLKVTVSPDKAICPGTSTQIGANGSGGDGFYNYSWSPATGLSCSTCQDPIATPTVSTQYTVTLTDNCGTPSVKDSVLVTLDPLPVVQFTADTLQGCSPLCVNFTDKTPPPPSLSSWMWSFGDGGTSTNENPHYCYDSAGIYTVSLIVTSDSGCVDSLTKPGYITVYSHPVAAFNASPQPTNILTPTIYFTDQSTDAYGIKSWFWQFHDTYDSTSILQNPQFVYLDTGMFCPTLTVTNVHGCTDEVQHCVEISPFFTLYIPNAFSPNGDGLNDVFTAKGTYVCGFEMYIFDRWGMLLYYTQDMSKGWDGTVQGGSAICQEDTYVYLITAQSCVDQSKHRYVGRVTIIK